MTSGPTTATILEADLASRAADMAAVPTGLRDKTREAKGTEMTEQPSDAAILEKRKRWSQR